MGTSENVPQVVLDTPDAPPQKPDIRKWIGSCKGGLGELGYESIDEFIEDVRGR